ncbi:hypothetical protein CHOED_090 [Vibrio phage CHOED]|uniref:hypothetical protein n=1 Tax=Vibrio phage CHOED TaxID=1458716 RepID=UPI00042F0EA6|nr:hypothetical protein CHOED_090 [Vibrio phage CHOED]AHK11950.1 hypothetical protein CHOED_090 [Vibrio phage CHOED]
MGEPTNLTDKELLGNLYGLMAHPAFPLFKELMRRRQAQQIKTVCSLSDPIDIYRAQGQVKGLDMVLNIEAEIKALK